MIVDNLSENNNTNDHSLSITQRDDNIPSQINSVIIFHCNGESFPGCCEINDTKECSDEVVNKSEILVPGIISHSNLALKSELTNTNPINGMLCFYIISFVYLAFTITDSSLRVAVLLHANNLGFTAFQIAIMFTLYEAFGVLTNLLGGILATKMGLKRSILAGLLCQIITITILSPFDDSNKLKSLSSNNKDGIIAPIIYIMFAQSFSGIAKDLIKLAGKSVSKLVNKKGDQSTLFRLVANITGAKNGIKGFGYFFGTFWLQFTGFFVCLIILLSILVALIPFVYFYLDNHIGQSNKKREESNKPWYQVFKKSREFNFLCLARLFLFGGRDLWFDIALPIYFKNILQWSSLSVGGFLAGWIILYGIIQSNTDLIMKYFNQFPPTTQHLWPLTSGLTALTAIIALTFTLVIPTINNTLSGVSAVLIIGLFLNAFIFAMNSSLHSYLVVELSDHDKVAQDVGFYYMSNALGRLTGSLLGGVLYSFYSIDSSAFNRAARSESLAACLWASGIFCLISTAATFFLRKPASCSTGIQ